MCLFSPIGKVNRYHRWQPGYKEIDTSLPDEQQRADLREEMGKDLGGFGEL